MPDRSGADFHHVGLSCRDPIAVERWYTRHFGFQRARVYAPGPEQVVMIRSGSVYLELFSSQGDSPAPPAEGAGPEVWIMSADASASPRRLTSGAQAGRVVWDKASGALWASGYWGSDTVSLSRVDISSGSLSPLERPFRISRDPAFVDFDFSRDGRLVAFSRDERRGDIWILDAATTPF